MSDGRTAFGLQTVAAVIAVTSAVSPVLAATYIKANNNDALNLTTSWAGGVVPGSGDVALWDNTVASANTPLLGANLSWQGLTLTNPSGPVTIGAGNTLTLGTSGINLSAATQDLTLNCGVTLAAGKQTWAVDAARTVTLANVASRSGTNALLQIGTTGLVKMGTASSALPVDGHGNAYITYGTNDWAALSSGTVVAATYTAAPASSTALVWTTSGVNYNITGDNTGGFTNASQIAASLRYDSATAYNLNIATGGSGAARTLTVGGILVTANATAGGTIGGNTNGFGTIRPFRVNGATGNPILSVVQNSAADFTIGAIVGNNTQASTLAKFGNGKLILTNANGYTGGTAIYGGTVQIGAGGTGGTLGTGGVTNSGILIFNRSNALTDTNAIGGAGTIIQAGGGALTLTGSSTFTGDFNLNAGTVLPGSTSNNVASPTGTPLGSSTVAHNVNVNNGATLQFSTGDNLGGATSTPVVTIVVNPGGLVTNTAGVFNTLGPVTLNGGTLTTAGGATADYQAYRLAGTVTAAGSAASTISGTGTNSGYHLSANTTFNVNDATVSSAADLTVSATLVNQTLSQSSAAGGLTKTGGGTLALSGGNTFSGTTTISAGVVRLDHANALQNSTVSLGVNDGLAFGAGITAPVLGGLGGSGTLSLVNVDGNNVAVSVGNNNAAASHSGVISGPGSITKTGNGTQTLAGSNTYSGGTLVSSGTLSLAHSNAGGTGTIQLANGVTLNVANASTFVSSPVAPTGTNANVLLTSADATGGFSSIFSGSADQTITIGGTTAVNLSSSAKQLQNFDGTVNVPSGSSLAFRNSNLNNGGDTALFTVNGGLSTRNGGSVALGSLGGSGTLGMGTSGASNVSLTYTLGARGTTADFSGTIKDGDTATGKLVRITKTGNGTQILSGSSTYTGGTTVNAGTLVANGASPLGTGAVNVNSGGTLAGTGTIAGAVNVNAGAVITAGTGATAADTPGTLTTTGTQTWTGNGTTESAGGTYVWKVGATATDTLEITLLNIVSTNGKFTLSPLMAGGTFNPDTTYTLAHVAGLQLNGVAQSVGSNLTSLFYLDLDGIGYADNSPAFTVAAVSDGGSGFSLQMQAAPEPTVLALTGLAAAPLLGRRRRKLQRAA